MKKLLLFWYFVVNLQLELRFAAAGVREEKERERDSADRSGMWDDDNDPHPGRAKQRAKVKESQDKEMSKTEDRWTVGMIAQQGVPKQMDGRLRNRRLSCKSQSTQK